MPDYHNTDRSSDYMVCENTNYLATRISKGRGGGSSPGCCEFYTVYYNVYFAAMRYQLYQGPMTLGEDPRMSGRALCSLLC